MSLPDRSPPYSKEAECGVLGSIILDAALVLPLCSAAGVTMSSFYVPAHRDVFEALTAMRPDWIDLLTIGDAMKTSGVLEQVGGYEFLEGLVADTPTTAHADYYIRLVREAEHRRQLIHAAQSLIDAAYSTPETKPGDLAANAVTLLQTLADNAPNAATFPVYTLADLEAFHPDPQSHVAGEGWLRAGAGTLLTGGTGMGKSVLAAQIAVSVAAGVPILGCLRVHRPVRVLCIQAENDAETLQRDFCSLAEATNAERATVQQNLRVIHAYGLAAEAFARFVRVQIRKHKPALLVIDPYQAFIGAGDINQSETFLAWIQPLDALLKEYRCALLLVAHTPKPKDRDSWHGREMVYMAAGSSVMANWARTSAELTTAGKEDGRYKLGFSKNAERTGLVDENQRQIREVFIEHSGNRHKPSWKISEDQSPPSNSKHKDAIIRLALEHPSMSYREIAKQVGCSVGTVATWYPTHE